MFKNFKFIIKAQLLKSRSTQLNQGERKKCEAFIETIKNNYSRDKRAVYLFSLVFLVLLFYQEKST
jgi:hypothetical protein